MSTTYITEFGDAAKNFAGVPIAAIQDNGLAADEGPTVGQTVEQTPLTNSGSSQQSAGFAPTTRIIRLTSDGIISYVIGWNPVVSTTNRRLPAGAIEYIGVVPGQRLAIITNT